MKTLLLMRHAKSSWKNPKLADHERPLNKRGRKDAPFMGEVLLEKELLPQKILASTAVRVRETIDGLVKASHYTGEIEYSDALYLAEPEAYLAAIRPLPDAIERVMVVGHNPGLEGLLQQLSGRIESIATDSVAYLSLPIQSWSELTNATEGDLVELLHLHDLRDEKDDKKKHKKDEKKYKAEEQKKLQEAKKQEAKKLKAAMQEEAKKLKAAKQAEAKKLKAAKLEEEKKLKALKQEEEKMLKSARREEAQKLKAAKQEEARQLKAAKQVELKKEKEEKKSKDEKKHKK